MRYKYYFRQADEASIHEVAHQTVRHLISTSGLAGLANLDQPVFEPRYNFPKLWQICFQIASFGHLSVQISIKPSSNPRTALRDSKKREFNLSSGVRSWPPLDKHVVVQLRALGLRFQVFRVTDVLRLRFHTFRSLRCSRVTLVQRIVCKIRRRLSGHTFSDVSAPLMLS